MAKHPESRTYTPPYRGALTPPVVPASAVIPSSGGLFDEAQPIQEAQTDRATGVESPKTEPVSETQAEPDRAAGETWKMFPPEPVASRYGEYPYDHSPVVVVSDNGDAVVAQWQISRRWNRRWEPYGFWAGRNTGGRPIGFGPVGYRELRE
jgi:hypothetical protein